MLGGCIVMKQQAKGENQLADIPEVPINDIGSCVLEQLNFSCNF